MLSPWSERSEGAENLVERSPLPERRASRVTTPLRSRVKAGLAVSCQPLAVSCQPLAVTEKESGVRSYSSLLTPYFFL